MPDITLTETVTVATRDATDEERYLAHRYNLLVDRCITWAGEQMRYGTHSTRLQLTKSVLSSAQRLAALDQKSQVETHRVAFQSLLDRMADISVPEPPALNGGTVDQDQES